MTINDCIARKVKNSFTRLTDVKIQIGGTSCNSVVINLTRDKYRNTDMHIDSYHDVDVMFDFPNGEIPTSLTNTKDTEGTGVLHLYDLVPITCHIKKQDIIDKKIKIGSIILYRIQNYDDSWMCIPFQITDAISKGNPSSAILWVQFIVAPVTSYQLNENGHYQELFDYYAENGNLDDFVFEELVEDEEVDVLPEPTENRTKADIEDDNIYNHSSDTHFDEKDNPITDDEDW